MDELADNAAPELGAVRHTEEGDATPLDLIAYRLARHTPSIVVADPKRSWMDEIPRQAGYRCLPMLMANQAGWFILNSNAVRVTWGGASGASSLAVEYLNSRPADPPVLSYFGSGILTWRIPILFRTPPEFNLWARGPASSPKMGAYPLEGIVETDWSPATFTMNWKILTPDQPVVFEMVRSARVHAGIQDFESFAHHMKWGPERFIGQAEALDFTTPFLPSQRPGIEAEKWRDHRPCADLAGRY